MDLTPRTEHAKQLELDEMRRIVVAGAMDEGAFSLLSGPIYAPGVCAATDELVALSEVLGRYGRLHTTHMRDQGARLEAAVEEAIRMGRDGGTSVPNSHHKAAGRRNRGRFHATLGLIEAAPRERARRHARDAYPYTAGSTFLSAVLPP